ncbi:Syntaxin-8 [Fukomys damarensis]|uniref:Syntaxin-8 n=1 Tax=Fukomys damarensis TaxID=885580 RepID=A0A091CJW7_FUKDA|nr:Syntaxin-8 [Fukomys damarensis]
MDVDLGSISEEVVFIDGCEEETKIMCGCLANRDSIEEKVRGSSLMREEAKQGASNPWLFEEPEETRGLGFDDLRQQQQKIIQEQDAGLDALSSIISRQKQMGQEIGNELDEQNALARTDSALQFLCAWMHRLLCELFPSCMLPKPWVAIDSAPHWLTGTCPFSPLHWKLLGLDTNTVGTDCADLVQREVAVQGSSWDHALHTAAHPWQGSGEMGSADNSWLRGPGSCLTATSV